MERFVLEVDGVTARAWRNSSADVRLQYENKIADVLRELKEAEFDKLLDRAGAIAKKKWAYRRKAERLVK